MSAAPAQSGGERTPVMTPRLLLRLEGLALLAVSATAYFALGGTAGWFFGKF